MFREKITKFMDTVEKKSLKFERPGFNEVCQKNAEIALYIVAFWVQIHNIIFWFTYRKIVKINVYGLIIGTIFFLTYAIIKGETPGHCKLPFISYIT